MIIKAGACAFDSSSIEAIGPVFNNGFNGGKLVRAHFFVYTKSRAKIDVYFGVEAPDIVDSKTEHELHMRAYDVAAKAKAELEKAWIATKERPIRRRK